MRCVIGATAASDSDDGRRKTIQRCVNCTNINTQPLEGSVSWQVTGNVLRFATSSYLRVFTSAGGAYGCATTSQPVSQPVSQLGRSNLEGESGTMTRQ